MTTSPPDGFLADCPARSAVELLADTWTVAVVAGLSAGPVRRVDLADRIGGISGKMLSQTLRRLQAHGLVARRPDAGAASRVEYELTTLGATLVEPILVLNAWARVNGDAVQDAVEAAQR